MTRRRIAILLHSPAVWPQLGPIARALLAGGDEVMVYGPDLEGVDFPYTFPDDWASFRVDRVLAFKPHAGIVWNGLFPAIYPACTLLASRFRLLAVEHGWLPQLHHLTIGPAFPHQLLDGHYRSGVARHHTATLESARRTYGIKVPDFGINAFVPLQREQDVSIQRHSPIFRTMDSLLAWACWFFGSESVVYREHPLEPHSHSRPGTRYDGPLRSIDLACGADFVVGINSTVLAEACLFQRNLVGFGRHVCASLFLNASDLYQTPRVLSGSTLASYRDRQDYQSLLLLANQYHYADPPGWALEMARGTRTQPNLI